MAVITISRQTGSLGNEIAKAAAEKLRYNRVGQSELSDALTEQGLGTREFEKFDGKKPSIWKALSHQKKRFIYFLRSVVYDFARLDNVILLGRGGQVLLKTVPGTLHVRIIAPYQTRVQRIMEKEDLKKSKAEEFILLSDHDSSGYISSFFGVDWNDVSMYDLVLNTRTMSVETAVSLIVEAAAAQDFNKSETAVEISLEKMALEQKIQGVLVGFPGIILTSVEVRQDEVVLTGVAKSGDSIDLCRKAVTSVVDDKRVHTKLDIVAITGI